MDHSCHYLCSELVTIIHADHSGELCETTANLEEISRTSATVLSDEKLRLGSPICLTLQDHDMFGLITSRRYDATLGWFVTITFDADSQWRRESPSPQHMLANCSCAWEAAA